MCGKESEDSFSWGPPDITKSPSLSVEIAKELRSKSARPQLVRDGSIASNVSKVQASLNGISFLIQ
ncbi:MAG: hypothetical protein GEU26_06475 [Nitrososphaeraceae archaeon]|nr:hypothetical protein [Nitrososphaeraceae archaeon]